MNTEMLKQIARELRDFENARPRLGLRLFNPGQNPELFDDLPCLPCLDLALAFVIFFEYDEETQTTALIRWEHLKNWGITPSELLPYAAENCPRCMPARISHVGSMLGSCAPPFDGIHPVQGTDQLYALSSIRQITGAVTMLYPGVLQNFASSLDDDLYIIPSSIHEVMFEPVRAAGMGVSDINKIILSVNEKLVRPEEQLSDHVYVYDHREDLIRNPMSPGQAASPFSSEKRN